MAKIAIVRFIHETSGSIFKQYGIRNIYKISTVESRFSENSSLLFLILEGSSMVFKLEVEKVK